MEKINKGDWIVWDFEGVIKYLKIEKIEIVELLENKKPYYEHAEITFHDKTSIILTKKTKTKLNKVTEPWKIMLLELDRVTPDFKPGDVIVTYQDVYVAGYHDHDEIVLLFEENLVTRFCPEEHSIEV